jgi:deoxycytidylate deaminase
MANPLIKVDGLGTKLGREARELIAAHDAKELIFAIVGHVGSGTSEIADALKVILEAPGLLGGPYDTVIIKASDRITDWATKKGHSIPPLSDKLERARRLQDLGDEMRETDHSAVATALIKSIRATRAAKQGKDPNSVEPVVPDGTRRAYVLDSIRHPAEVHLLRNVYSTSFTLIGVVCNQSKRLSRVQSKYSNAGQKDALAFMERDAKAAIGHGQKVSDAFHLADYFIDNSADRFLPDGESNREWTVPEDLDRLIKIITHSHIVRPSSGETAMFEAHGAALRSACLSRQVGACIVDCKGNVIATGTNEVPSAGGGLYGESFDTQNIDGRCAHYQTPHCRNTEEQNKIIAEILDGLSQDFPELALKRTQLESSFRKTGIGGLLEFSRAVHAEMDALLTAARKGVSCSGTRMFVTTFPCHYCARHIVSAGVDEVQFIEPYPKSKTLDLHPDSVTLEPQGWLPPSSGGKKVFFHPFTGVAPILYRRAFLKDRELKEPATGVMKIGDPDWGSPWHIKRISYVEIEAELSKVQG